jgi:nucleotide-binding universal stress UspA family protein
MYRKILITLENRPTDETILRHVEPLAALTQSAILLVHVADGWAARNYNALKLADSEEMKADRAYLAEVAARFRALGLTVESELLLGDPANEIIKIARESGADLIAMTTHGHRLLSDLLYGTTVDKVRHTVDIPVLLLKAPRP